MDTKVTLASKSPRRRELFKEICSSFLCIDTEIDEEESKKLAPLECVRDLAKRKAKLGAKSYPDDLVIGCDTIVILEDEIIGKPYNYDRALDMLHTLSDKTHEVVTAYTFIYQDHELDGEVHSFVKFNKLDDELIERYVKEKAPYDKAGAYGIQESSKEYPLIDSFRGSYTNIMGFPTSEILKDLKKFCSDFDLKIEFLH
ncbi:MAG: Maf family protein [Coprobacillus sp.]|nr:Maf family protein [Coprobacillus sp.]